MVPLGLPVFFFTNQNVGNSWLTVVCLHCRSTNVTVEMHTHVSWPYVCRHERTRLVWIYRFIERLQKHIKKLENLDVLQLAQDRVQWRDYVNTSEASCSITRWAYLDQLLQHWLLTCDIRHHVLKYLIFPYQNLKQLHARQRCYCWIKLLGKHDGQTLVYIQPLAFISKLFNL